MFNYLWLYLTTWKPPLSVSWGVSLSRSGFHPKFPQILSKFWANRQRKMQVVTNSAIQTVGVGWSGQAAGCAHSVLKNSAQKCICNVEKTSSQHLNVVGHFVFFKRCHIHEPFLMRYFIMHIKYVEGNTASVWASSPLVSLHLFPLPGLSVGLTDR